MFQKQNLRSSLLESEAVELEMETSQETGTKREEIGRSRELEMRSRAILQVVLKIKEVVSKRGGLKREPVEQFSKERSRNLKEELDVARDKSPSSGAGNEIKCYRAICPKNGRNRSAMPWLERRPCKK